MVLQTGGAIATVFDNVLGYQVIRAIGLNQSTLQLNVSYRKFIPLCTTVRMTCQVDRQEGRKSWVSAKVRGDDCHAMMLCAEANVKSPSMR